MNDDDADAAVIMREYAGQAVVQAQQQHGIDLDYTEQSLFRLDLLLSQIAGPGVLPLPAPGSEADQTLWLVSKAYGGYLGEVMRQQLDGTWHFKRIDGADIVQMQVGTFPCSPPERVW